jgi:hypothetical protein
MGGNKERNRKMQVKNTMKHLKTPRNTMKLFETPVTWSWNLIELKETIWNTETVI